VIDELQSTIPGCYWTNQYNNPDGAEAHYALTGAEICSQLPDLEYAFIGVSSAGTIAGVSRRLKEHNPAIRVIAVDAEGSSIFGGAPKKRSIPGIGASIVPPLLRSAFIDDVVIVPECDTIAACHELLFRHAIFAGGSSGTAYSAVENYIATHDLPRGTKCLFLCCDRGTAYLKSIYDFACAPLAHVASPGGLPFR
jgi:cysteine synthase A